MRIHFNREEADILLRAIYGYTAHLGSDTEEKREYRRRARKVQGKLKWRLTMRDDVDAAKTDSIRLRAALNYLQVSIDNLTDLPNWEPELSVLRQINKKMQEQVNLETSLLDITHSDFSDT